jgi:hypothetical protein
MKLNFLLVLAAVCYGAAPATVHTPMTPEKPSEPKAPKKRKEPHGPEENTDGVKKRKVEKKLKF